jgi:uroporphyrinogen decarboxylase
MPMTSRQRIEAALRHQEPDRTPMFEYVLLSPVADRLLGRPYAADPSHWPAVREQRGWEGAVRQGAIDHLDLACLLGHDMMYVRPNPLPRETDAALPAPPAVPSDDPVDRVKRRNGEAAGVDPSPPDDGLLVYVLLKQEMERRGADLPVLAPAYAHGIWTDVDLMMAMALAPEVAREHFALATRRSLACVEKYVALGVDQIGVGGDFAGNRPLISPEAYRTFIVPEVRAVTRRIHEAGRWAVNASDGNLWPMIEDFLFGCQVDGYLEIDLGAGMDLERLKAAYGDRITFYGNLDCGLTLSFASPEEVRRHTIRCLEAGLGRGGHILCASNAITAAVPLENYLAVVEAYRGFFGLGEWRLPR